MTQLIWKEPFESRSRKWHKGPAGPTTFGADFPHARLITQNFPSFFHEDASISSLSSLSLLSFNTTGLHPWSSMTRVSLIEGTFSCPWNFVYDEFVVAPDLPFAEDSTYTLPDKLPLTQTHPLQYNFILTLNADSLCRLKRQLDFEKAETLTVPTCLGPWHFTGKSS